MTSSTSHSDAPRGPGNGNGGGPLPQLPDDWSARHKEFEDRDLPPLTAKRALLRMILQLLLGGTILTVATHYTHSCAWPQQIRSTPVRMVQEKPDLVMVGNSVLRLGVDEKALSKKLKRRVMKVTSDGSMSAFWYVVAKNVVAGSDHKPKALIICFRDQHLTAPTFGLTGYNAFHVRALSQPDGEPVLEELAYRKLMGPVKYFAFKHWPLFRVRDTIVNTTERKWRNKVLAPLLHVDRIVLGGAYFAVTSDKRMIREMMNEHAVNATSLQDPKSLNFDANLDQSFLPHIFDALEAKGVQVVLSRMRRLGNARADARGDPQSPALVEYVTKLRDYCESRGGLFLDFSQDERITEEWFGVGDHFTEEGGERFTDLMAEALAPHFGRS